MKTIFVVSALLLCVFGQVQQKQQQEALTASDVKISTSVDILTTENLTPDVYLQAIADAFDAIFKSRLIILPSTSMKDKQDQDMEYFNKTMEMIDDVIDALETHVTTIDEATPVKTTTTTQDVKTETTEEMSIKVAALDAWDVLLITKEMLEALASYTRKCDPNVQWNLQSEMCSFLKDADEDGNLIDAVLQGVNMKSLRAPFFFLNQPKHVGNYVLTHQTGNLKNGECSAIVESVAGIKAILRTATISLWNLPLAEGRTLQGQKHFVFEWVPSEYLKTLTLCNPVESKSPGLTQKAETTWVHLRGVNQFQRLWTVSSQWNN